MVTKAILWLALAVALVNISNGFMVDSEEGSGDGQVTRSRPEQTTPMIRMKKSRCYCYLQSKRNSGPFSLHPYMNKLNFVVGNKVKNPVYLSLPRDSFSCEQIREQCILHCESVGQMYFSEQGLATKMSAWGRDDHNLGDYACKQAGRADASLTVKVVAYTSCIAPGFNKSNRYGDAHLVTDSLCCEKEGRRGQYRAALCPPDSGSGDGDGVGRPDIVGY